MLIATFVVAAPAPGVEPLDAIADTVCERLGARRASAPRSLAKNWAFEVSGEFETSADAIVLRDSLRDALEDHTLDINAVDPTRRPFKLLVADMESTLIGQECLDELADFVGLRARVADITERAMRGELDFEAALDERVGLLKGLPVARLDDVLRERVQATSGAETLIATLRAHCVHCALVSGGFTAFADPVAAKLGCDTAQANTLDVADGVLTGTVARPILGREAKETALRAHAQELGAELTQTIAIGDGANDLAMIGAAGLGVAFHAKPAVAEAASARIDHGDLCGLLFLAGIAEHHWTLPEPITSFDD